MVDLIFEIFRSSNKYIDDTMPWVLFKEDEKQIDTCYTNYIR